jgi:hypothetical protein
MKMDEEPKPIRELLHPKDYSRSMDLRETPTGRVCICGCEIFIALVAFDEANEISFYFLDGECADCGSMVTLPYPENGEFDCA